MAKRNNSSEKKHQKNTEPNRTEVHAKDIPNHGNWLLNKFGKKNQGIKPFSPSSMSRNALLFCPISCRKTSSTQTVSINRLSNTLQRILPSELMKMLLMRSTSNRDCLFFRFTKRPTER